MKKWLAVSLLSLGAAIALLAAHWGQQPSAGNSVAEAAANSVTVIDQQCLSADQVRVVFSWTGYNEGPQWVDLSLTNNGFFPGTFVGLGPLASNQTTFTWDGILAGLTHYLRVNTLTSSGWSTSATLVFATRSDCQYVSQIPQGVGATNLVLNQVCLQNGTPRMALTWTSSNQGQQWFDDSPYNANFAPNTFTSVGPFAPYQNVYAWDGYVPGSLHYIRINTGTPYGWYGSTAIAFYVRADCQFLVQPTATAIPAATATVQPTVAPTATVTN